MKDGSIFEGMFSDGLINGYGVITNKDGK